MHLDHGLRVAVLRPSPVRVPMRDERLEDSRQELRPPQPSLRFYFTPAPKPKNPATGTRRERSRLDQLALSAKIPTGIIYGDLMLSPQWDALRGEPRFERIVASLARRLRDPLSR